MKFSRKTAALAFLAAAYATSAFVVFRHKAVAAARGKVTIRICHWQLEAGVRDAFDAIIHRYEQLNPNVDVVQIAIPAGALGANYTTWVLTQMASGHGPDLAEYDAFHPDLARLFQPFGAEVIKPNPYNRGTSLEGIPWRDTFIDGMLTTSYDRNLNDYYAVPLDVNVQRILYNRTLMKAVTGRGAAPRTYRELLALCAKIRTYAAANHLILSPMANPPESDIGQSWDITTHMDDRLSERIDFQHRLMVEPDDLGQSYLRGEWSYDTPEAVAAFQEVKEFGEMSAPGFFSRPRDAAVTDFVCGRAVMFVAPSWESTSVLGLCDFPIGVFRYPYPREDDPVYGRYVKGPFSDGALVPGMPIYLSRATKHRAEALDFMKFLTSQEGGTLFSRYSNWQSATIDVKPSDFAAQFQFIRKGYSWNGVLFVLDVKNDANFFLREQLPALWIEGQGLDAFRKAMREGMAGHLRDDFKQEIVSAANFARASDAEAASQVEADHSGLHAKPLPIVPSSIDGLLYQNQALVDPPPAADGFVVKLRPSPPGPAAPGPADEADRQARFRAGLDLFAKQEPYDNRLDEVSRIFTGLADSGRDDPALGARFFLARIAQHHRTPDANTEAAKQFSEVISESPQSYWAQEALGPLALLEIYALDTSSPPAKRIGRAEGLLDFASSAHAKNELSITIAYAIFFYRLPCGQALSYLLTVDRLDLVNGPTRADVLLQIAELSRLAGKRAQAATHYRAFVAENPADFRDYLAQERLAAMLK